jgi:hypothetical protein
MENLFNPEEMSVNQLIIALRHHVCSRFDVTGRPYIENGAWAMMLAAANRLEELIQMKTAIDSTIPENVIPVENLNVDDKSISEQLQEEIETRVSVNTALWKSKEDCNELSKQYGISTRKLEELCTRLISDALVDYDVNVTYFSLKITKKK